MRDTAIIDGELVSTHPDAEPVEVLDDTGPMEAPAKSRDELAARARRKRTLRRKRQRGSAALLRRALQKLLAELESCEEAGILRVWPHHSGWERDRLDRLERARAVALDLAGGE